MEILIYDLKQRFPKDSVNVEERVVTDLWLLTQLGKIFWTHANILDISFPSHNSQTKSLPD